MPTDHSLRITEAATMVGVHPNTVRSAIKSGDLKATLQPGQWGRPQYAINPSVFKVWALERFGRDIEPVEEQKKERGLSESERDLYERLVKQTEELARYKALEAVTGKTSDELQAELVRLQNENRELQNKLDQRGWLRRLF